MYERCHVKADFVAGGRQTGERGNNQKKYAAIEQNQGRPQPKTTMSSAKS